jgi:hypothetical protein
LFLRGLVAQAKKEQQPNGLPMNIALMKQKECADDE